MHLIAFGINHHSAPVSLREKVAFSPESLQSALAELRAHLSEQSTLEQTTEAAILSTCNRTEIYCVVPTTMPPQHTLQWLAQHHGVAPHDLNAHLFTHTQEEAVRHAFRVASGLDSMVLGETQILGQLKDAVRTASNAGALGTYLNQLFQRTFAVAKEVRGQTEIGAHSVSMAAAAVRLAQRLFDSIAKQRVLMIGAGEMIELCATHFAAQHPKQVVIANRTLERGEKLAAALADQGIASEAMLLADVPKRLAEFDIVISCTASTLPILGLGMVERAVKLRKHRPIFMVDLAVPRDIEPEVADLSDVYLYTVDDLGRVVQEGNALRQAAANQAEAIIETRVQHFMHWLADRNTVPLIRQLHTQGEHLRQVELERAMKRLAKGDDPSAVLEALSLGLTNKFLHGPTQALHQSQGEQREALVQLLPHLFRSSSHSER